MQVTADRDPDLKRTRVIRWTLVAPVALMVAGFCAYMLRATDMFRAVPGGLGDPRFNSVVLEHLFQWISGDAASLWSPNFFYPARDALAFSDNHFGSGIVYIFFRFLGFGREGAFNGWLSVGYLLNFVAMYVVMRRLRFDALPAAVAAFLYTFAPPILAQESHAQLSYRFGIPLAWLAFLDFVRSRRLNHLARLMVWGVLQLLCSIYLGVFLAYLLAATAAAMLLPWIRKSAFPAPQDSEDVTLETRHSRYLSIVVAAVCAIVGLGLLAKYHSVSRHYGFTRDFAEIASMLPRPQSYLLADGVAGYRSIGTMVSDVPMRHEQQMFPGLVSIILIFSACFVARGSRTEARSRLLAMSLLSLALLVLITLSVHGHSAYRGAMSLPGVSSIRAVSRIVLVMMLPIAVAAAIGMENLQRLRYGRLLLPALLTLGLVLEVLGYTPVYASIDQWTQRHADLEAMVRGRALKSNSILYVTGRSDEPEYLTELDAMILGQDLKLPVLNGYSGNAPPGYQPPQPCVSAAARIYGVLDAVYLRAGVSRENLLSRVESIAREPCKQNAAATGAASVPPSAAQAAKIRLIPHIAATDGRELQVDLQLKNDSDLVLHSMSSTGHPLRISWRFVQPGTGADPPWDNRYDAAFSVPPGGEDSIHLQVQAPATRGSYELQFNLVAENAVWLNAIGMQIGRIPVGISSDGSADRH